SDKRHQSTICMTNKKHIQCAQKSLHSKTPSIIRSHIEDIWLIWHSGEGYSASCAERTDQPPVQLLKKTGIKLLSRTNREQCQNEPAQGTPADWEHAPLLKASKNKSNGRKSSQTGIRSLGMPFENETSETRDDCIPSNADTFTTP